MGASHGSFVKYPRTPHLFSAVGSDDDKHLNDSDSLKLIADPSLIVEEKIDGTNVGIHFDDQGEMVLQCRGHLITEGMHPQYDLFKQWAAACRHRLETKLQNRYLLFGEWVYAQHSIRYRQLPHYFFEFDVYDKNVERFLSLERRLELLSSVVQTVPILHRGAISQKALTDLIGPSKFDSRFDNPSSRATDNLMEGVYVRTEAEDVVTARAKMVRPEFVEKIKQSTHWQSRPMIVNQLSDNADIWS